MEIKKQYRNVFRIDESHGTLTGIEGDGDVWILSLRVEPEHRNLNIGSDMVKSVLKEFQNYTVFYLYALADSPEYQMPLERFYQRLGFEVFGPQKSGTATLMRRKM